MIPKVLHLIWVDTPFPDHLATEVATFSEHHPDWEVRWWTGEEIKALGMMNENLYSRADELVPAHAVPQMRSDLARYEILLRHGGVYADCDYRWQGRIDPHLAGHQLVTCWEKDGEHVANGFIAAAPRHVALAEAMVEAPARASRASNWWSTNRYTGPHLWTPIARKYAHILPSQVLHPVPWDNPGRADTETFPQATAVHLWNHARTLRGIR